MKSIWKYKLEVTDIQTVKLPENSEILCVQSQGGVPMLWALVNPEEEKGEVTISTIGTGHHIADDFDGKYLGTYQLHEGQLVFHVFERYDQ